MPLKLEFTTAFSEKHTVTNGEADSGHVRPPRCCLRRRSFRGEPGVNPRRRFNAATRNHPHLACTSNPSTTRKLEPNRRAQKNAGKRVVFGLGAGGRRTPQKVALRFRSR